MNDPLKHVEKSALCASLRNLEFLMIITVFVYIKKGFTFTVATRYICFHVYS